jgi:glycosyltransferase involved in cell wall biosynthesis
MNDTQLVSVVIPAYNAAATLDETLRSVRSQTHRALEIIVVDDGSVDETRAIAERHADVDNRVQVIHQANAGVAAARNAGWRRARSDLIAFVDADDLWAPRKIERQVHALELGGERLGLVYCWFVRIDVERAFSGRGEGPRWEGDVLEHIFTGNFIGNGSAVLVRRKALVDANGFEIGLRSAGAEGCEDYLLYCRIAERYHYAVVPEHFVGYRQLPHNMSSNRPRMLRSYMLAVDEMRCRHPSHSATLVNGLRQYGSWLVRETLCLTGYRQLLPLLLLLARYDPAIAAKVLARDVGPTLIEKLGRRLNRLYRGSLKPTNVRASQRFLIGDVDGCR